MNTHIEVGETYFVNVSYRANLRSGPSTDADVLGYVYPDDSVEVLSFSDSYEWMKIKVLSARDQHLNGRVFYFFADLMSLKPNLNSVSYKSFSDYMEDSQFMIIQNVATEKFRVYEICRDDCPNGHKMIFETDMVVGDPDKNRTWLGNYFIKEWKKNYEDNAGKYPAYYRPDYPPIPDSPNSKWWISNEALAGTRAGEARKKYGSKYGARGAFGWYAALVGPGNHDAQWVHGTFGVAKDDDYFIRFARGETFTGALISLFYGLRSSGCSRLANPQIAYLRQLLPEGTPIIKIYALEGVASKEFLKGARNENDGEETSSFEWSYSVEISEDNFQSGVTKIDTRPTPAARHFDGNYNCSAKKGDVYCIGTNRKLDWTSKSVLRLKGDGAFRGVFLVDEGRLVDYSHPDHENIVVGGYETGIHPLLISEDKKFYKKTRFARGK